MEEYVTDAVVLRKDPRGDLDGRYTFFTKRFGKISGKATSSRKITSKLAPHLEPGTAAKVRFVETKDTQIVDALKIGRISLEPNELRFLSDLMPEGIPEPDLWGLLADGGFTWRKTLGILGWDPEDASCAACGMRPPTHFYITRQEFYCRTHASRAPKDAVISIDAGL